MKIIVFVLSICFLGCGVKGPPLPPDTPTQIGRGKPSYQKAMRRVPVDSTYEEDEDEDEEDLDDEE